MAVTPARARKLALSLDNASEAPHFDRAAFRTPRKIFATLANCGVGYQLDVRRGLQEFYCEQAPRSDSRRVPGGWGTHGRDALRLEIDRRSNAPFRAQGSARSSRAKNGRKEMNVRHIARGPRIRAHHARIMGNEVRCKDLFIIIALT